MGRQGPIDSLIPRGSFARRVAELVIDCADLGVAGFDLAGAEDGYPASRFKAMSAAKERSVDTANTLHTEYNRAKRNQVDTRLKESLAGLKKIRAEGAS